MTNQKSFSHLMDSGFVRISTLIILVFFLFTCQREQFKWKTKSLNTREEIPGRDSLIFIDGISSDSKYGYSPNLPIRLGVKSFYTSLTYPDKYFNSITGPQGETVIFERIKSCCPFKTVNSNKEEFKNIAVLEMYEVTYRGLQTPVILYINFFDEGSVLAPKGFLPRKFLPN